jgi:hypothetical protein
MPAVALAYRPFDSTDADVAREGELELELGPVGYWKTAPNHFLVAPASVLNLGVGRDWELVLQGRHLILLDDRPGEARLRLVDTGFFFKGVLREGSLQDGAGPSLALELGPLLPTLGGEPGMGASAAFILSQRWQALTIHLNGEAAITRAQHLELFGGVILEGPSAWPVRPVLELFVDREFGAARILSGLAGAIWQLSEALSFDVGVRAAHVVAGSSGQDFEVRAGLTWTTSLYPGSPDAHQLGLNRSSMRQSRPAS